MRTALHCLAHLLHLQRGRVDHYKRGGHWFLAFICSTCGHADGEVHMDSCDCRYDGVLP